MRMIEQYQKLDDLIVEHTTPPVQGILRYQLAMTREQVEAYQAASDSQDATLARQAETISELQSQLDASRLKVGVTLRNGTKEMYEGDFYVILPNKNDPQMVEFRKSIKANHTYQTVGHVKWADVSTLHGPDFLV